MKITSAEFIKSATADEHFPLANLPEIAFMGRSNVGKSSLLNSLLTRKNLARTSRTPGRTQLINFFLVNNNFRFVDLPGYGFARVPVDIKREWGAMVTNYLANRARLVLSIHIVDLRHEPTRQDLELHEWLVHYEKPVLTVATKSDKLGSADSQRNLKRVREVFGGEVLPFSALTGKGREEIWQAIQQSAASTS